jgi:uncharacterized membrane protein
MSTPDRIPPRAWVIVALLAALALGIWLRAPGVHWLAGAGPQPEFSFHPDDHRFLGSARNFAEQYPDGYVMGMATQLYVALNLAELSGPVNAATLMRAVSQFYAALTLLLTYFVGRRLGVGRLGSVLAVTFLAIAPMHLVNANFGTPDATLLAFFYGTFLAAAAWLRTSREAWFITCVALAGGAMALKFFLPAAALAGAAILLSPQRAVPSRYVSALLIGIAGFFLFSLFNYTIWQLVPLIRMLAFDNVIIPGGHGPVMQAIKYAGDLVPGLGIPLALLFALGALLALQSAYGAVQAGWAQRPASGAALRFALEATTRPPLSNIMVLACALAMHAMLIVTAGIHGPRHILVFIPVACIVAGAGFERLWDWGRLRPALATAAVVVLGYGVYNADATQAMYRTDLRNDMAAWARPLAADGKRIVSLFDYARVAGTYQVQDHEDARKADYFLTCDIEFRRYFKVDDASDVHHGYGQDRLEFYRALFAGKESFVVERAFAQQPTSFELGLIERRLLPPYGMFIPRRCMAFRRVDTPPGVADPRALDAIDLARNSW